VTSDREVEPIRVLVCDDHAVFRRGLAMVLEPEPDIVVVGEAGDGHEAIEQACESAPDVVLLDVRMPGTNGIAAARRLAVEVPSARVVMLTVSDTEEDLYDALKAGAVGYLLKELSIEEVADAVRAVAAGQSLVTPSMASKLLTEFTVLANRVDGGRLPGSLPRLTAREGQVLGGITRSLSNREIAAELIISENTVKNHVRNILEKLQLHSRHEVALYAVRQQIADLDS
jgi:two-component system NarL family response regulator